MLNGMNFDISEKFNVTVNAYIVFLIIFAFTKQINIF